jgi:OPA family glycerol-3-phosphate transporter-like MFS transporter 1/2
VPFGILGILVALVVQIVLKTPKDLNMEITEDTEVKVKPFTSSEKPKTSHSMSQLFAIPAVPELCFAVFCLKFVRYIMFMWLPMYLIEHLGYSKVQGGAFSTMFDIGGILGGPCLGVFVDKIYPGRPMLGIYQVRMFH